MNELQKFILAFLAASLGLTKTEIEDKVLELETSEEARKEFFDLHKAKVSELKKTAFTDGHKKAEKNVKGEFEKELKEKFGIESEKQGIELVEEVVTAKSTTTTTSEVTDEDVKKHPVYLALEKDKKKAEKTFQDELQAKIKEVEDGYAMQQTKTAIVEKAVAKFKALNPVLSVDAEKAERQIASFKREIESGNYKVEGDQILILNADGSRAEDGHGNPISFDDYVGTKADYLGFDFKQAEERDSSGGGNNQNQQQQTVEKKYTGEMPKTQNELFGILFNPDLTNEQKAEVQAAWDQSGSK